MISKYHLQNSLAVPNLWKIFPSQNSSPLRRYIWSLAFLICIALFTYETIDRVGNLRNPSKSASIKLSFKKTLAFPAVSVCPGYPFRSSILNKLGLDKYGCKPGKGLCTWDFPWSMATHTETIIKSCRYKTSWNCNPGTEEKGKWRRLLTSVGRCFTFEAVEPVVLAGESGGLEISIDPMMWDSVEKAKFNGIRVFVHHPSEIPMSEINGINIKEGSSAIFALLIKDFDRVNDISRPCELRKEYIRSKCIMNCTIHVTMQKTNHSCGAPFSKKFDIKTCQERKEIMHFMTVYNGVISNGSVWRQCFNQCPNLCHERIYTPITTSLGFSRTNQSDSLVNLTIYYNNMWLEHIVEQWDYAFQDFISDTGGSLTLFLGASFYSVIQVFDFFLALVVNKFKTLRRIQPKMNKDGNGNKVDTWQLAW